MNSPISVNSPSLKGHELKYLTECIETGWISSEGPFVEHFERRFSGYIGMKYGVAISSGSAALDIAVQALELGPGDEVIMPTFTIISPALSVIRAGAIPVLVDSVEGSWTMNIEQIEKRITKRTKAILVVHVYGIPTDMRAIKEIADRHKLLIIEDAAEMIGQKIGDQHCGSFGDITIFSFYPNKHVTTGEGGMVLTNDLRLAQRSAKLKNLAFEPEGRRFYHFEMGWNYRMSNLHAAVGLAQLEQIQEFIMRKRIMGSFFRDRLQFLVDKGYQLPITKTSFADNIYWVFGIIAPDEESLQNITNHLAKHHIGWRPFFWCMHEQPVFTNKGLFLSENYPVAERLARRGFYLPSGLGLEQSEMDRICDVISGFFN